jgi:hypothetical protein
MTKREDIGSIKTKLDSFEAQAPDFDALFGTEVLGDAELRRICQSKLNGYVTEAPPFRQSRPLIWWSAGIAAAASLALLFLLPTQLNQPTETLALLDTPPVLEVVKEAPTTKAPVKQFITERLATPTQIQEIEQPASPDILQTESAEPTAETTNEQDRSTLEKLNPTHFLTLNTGNSISVEEAYARARATKKQKQKEKMLAGLNLNGGNRLLSFVNTNPGSNPLLAKGNTYGDGLNVLEGAPMALRTAESSRNDWTAPTNIPASTLSNYEATYKMPLTLGLSVSLPLNNWLEIQTGLNYTYLFSRTEGLSGTSTFTLDRELHYVGIPLRLGINLYHYDDFRVYMAIGGVLEKGLLAKQTSTVIDANNATNDWSDRQNVYGVQPISTVMAGISYEFAPSFLVYIEPGATYAYEADQPISSRTEEPFAFSLGLGLRYRFK